MSAQHTPGAWKHEAPPPDAYTDPDIMLDEDVKFWIMDNHVLGEVLALVNRTAHGEEEANARLLAAAPELLKVAHAASHALKSYAYGNSATDLAEECAAALDEAIAKAEGRL